MPKVVFVHPDGTRQQVAGHDGDTVMFTATNNLVDGIIGECGGELSCSTCHIFVDPTWFASLKPKSDDEEDMLEAASEEPTDYSRLSCQIKLDAGLDGLVVNIPPSQR